MHDTSCRRPPHGQVCAHLDFDSHCSEEQVQPVRDTYVDAYVYKVIEGLPLNQEVRVCVEPCSQVAGMELHT